MKMKRFLTLLLAIAMTLSLSACGGGSGGSATNTAEPVATSEPAVEPQGIDGETIETDVLNVTYAGEWVYDEENSYMSEGYANLNFDYGEEDCWLTIYTENSSTYFYRRVFTNADIELIDLAEGRLNSLEADGQTFYDYGEGRKFCYFHVPSGVSYFIVIGGSDADINDSAFSDIIPGIKLKLTDEGKESVPWPWEGEPLDPVVSPQMVGTFTLTPTYLPADEPIVLKNTMYTSFALSNGMIYTVMKKEMSAYSIFEDGVTFEKSEKLPKNYEMIRSDKAGNLYLSQGIFEVSVYDGFTQTNATEISQDLIMHPSGEWGITFWVSSDPMKVTYSNGIYKEEPWVLKNLSSDETREGFFSMISDIRISDKHIIVAGKSAEDDDESIMVYDYNGVEQFRLGEAGMGSITGIVETPNGFLATDGNMRDIFLWTTDGTFIGGIGVPELLGLRYCWLEDMQLMDDGSVLIAASQERDDKSADELLFFKLTGF